MNEHAQKPENPSGARFPLDAEDIKILGADFVNDLHLLYDYLEPYEEWACAGDLTTMELLQSLKEEGFFKDLRILETMVLRLIASFKAITQRMEHLYGSHAEKKKDQALERAKQTLFKLRTPDRPLMSELVWLMMDAKQMMNFVDCASRIQKDRNLLAPLAAGPEWKVKAKVERDVSTARLKNFCNGMIFLAETNRQTFLSPQAQATDSAQEVFKECRWMDLKSAERGQVLQYTIGGRMAEGLGLKINIIPFEGVKHGVFESLHVIFKFNSTVQDPTMGAFSRSVPLGFTVALSRVHPELTLPGNGYVSVKPLFEAYGLGGFYENLKAYVWELVRKGIEQGSLLPVEVKVVAESLEPVRERVQTEVADQVPLHTEQKTPKTKYKKGLRQTTRNIEMADVLSTLELFSISHQSGGSHFILKGLNLKTGEEKTLAIPFKDSANQNGNNSAPYIAQASRIFGFNRAEFLEKLTEI